MVYASAVIAQSVFKQFETIFRLKRALLAKGTRYTHPLLDEPHFVVLGRVRAANARQDLFSSRFGFRHSVSSRARATTPHNFVFAYNPDPSPASPPPPYP